MQLYDMKGISCSYRECYGNVGKCLVRRPAVELSGGSGRALDIQRLHAIPLAHLESRIEDGGIQNHSNTPFIPFPTQNQAQNDTRVATNDSHQIPATKPSLQSFGAQTTRRKI